MEEIYKYTFGKDSITVLECRVMNISNGIVWYKCPIRNGLGKTKTVEESKIDTEVVSTTGRKTVILSRKDISKAKSIVRRYYNGQIASYKSKINTEYGESSYYATKMAEKIELVDGLNKLPVEVFTLR